MNTKEMDVLLRQHGEIILKNLAKAAMTTDDGVYYLTSITQDNLRMLFSIIFKNLPPAQAKMAFKIAIDSCILNYGMSIEIQDFEQ